MGFLNEKGLTLEMLKQQFKGRNVAEFCIYHYKIVKTQTAALIRLNEFKGQILPGNFKYVDDYFKYGVVSNFQFKYFWKGDLGNFLDQVEACHSYSEDEIFDIFNYLIYGIVVMMYMDKDLYSNVNKMSKKFLIW